MSPITLNPAQEAVLSLLGKGGERPPLPPSIAGDLRAALDEALAPLRPDHDHQPEDTPKKLWVSKRALAAIHGCEAHAFASRADDFRWSPATARGTVAHKAIELMVNWQGDAPPAHLVDEAIVRLTGGDRGIADYLGALPPGERAELRGFAVDRVTKFADCFPPIRPAWRPVTESAVRVELWDGLLVLSGKTDLTLGRPGERVIIDLKSGGSAPYHREDLRFYALLETIRQGLAPRKVATYYLDSGRPHVEDVTEGMLWAALHRTVDGVVRLVELERGARSPEVRPGPTCRWCPLADTCGVGREHLAKLDDPEAVGPW